MRVAVIGLGTMGAPMAGHLLDAGHEVTVHNRTRERELPLAERGAARAASPAEAAARADAVLICVSDTPDLEAVLFGGAEGAQNGTLTIFVGGSSEHVERAQPILQAFGKRITHLGPSGSGQMAKAVNQVMIAGTYATVGEGIALAQAAGLPLEQLMEALSAGAAASWVLANRAQNMVDDSYPLGFKVSLHRKDVAIALDEARRLGLDLGVSQVVLAEENDLIGEGHGDEDVSALARIAKRRSVHP